jgi:hypothetical protein
MILPLLKKLATEPDLFVEHASAYASLATLEAMEVGAAWRRQLIAIVACALMGLMALGFTGMAAMFFAALPWQAMPAPWVLVGVPAGLWLVTGLTWWWAAAPQRPRAFAHLRQQWAADTQLMRDVAQAS